jgi:hypothetical protein
MEWMKSLFYCKQPGHSVLNDRVSNFFNGMSGYGVDLLSFRSFSKNSSMIHPMGICLLMMLAIAGDNASGS